MTPPGPMGEPGDIRFDFRDTIEARQAALVFAQELQKEIAERLPMCHVEFVGASDHYHLLVMERQAHLAQMMARLGAGMVGALAKGVTNGKRLSGSIKSIAGLRWRATGEG